jgi:hypothetical protein
MREDNPEISTEIVVSREKKPLMPRKIHREAAEAIGLPLAHWLPDEPKLSRQALDRGEPLSLLAPRCAVDQGRAPDRNVDPGGAAHGNEGVGRKARHVQGFRPQAGESGPRRAASPPRRAPRPPPTRTDENGTGTGRR